MQVNWEQLYDQAKYWLPLITIFSLLVHAYRTTGKKLTTWAESIISSKVDPVIVLLKGVNTEIVEMNNNHLAHIESATKETLTVLTSMHESQLRVEDKQDKVAAKIEQVTDDLRDHEKDDNRIQGEILASLEVLKDRT